MREQIFQWLFFRFSNRPMQLIHKGVLIGAVVLSIFMLIVGCSKNNEGVLDDSLKTEPSLPEPISTESGLESISNRSNIGVVFGENNAVIFSSGHAIIVEGRQPSIETASIEYASNGDAAAFLLDKENEVGKLYFTDGVKCEMVSDDVSQYSISADGSTIAYLKSPSEYGVGSLYVYISKDNTSSLISDSAGRHFEISPSGQAVVYTVFPDVFNTLIWETHYSIMNEEANKLGENLYPITITDDGKLIYVVSFEFDANNNSSDYEFIVYSLLNGNNQNTVLSNSMAHSCTSTNVIFSEDRSQVLFSDHDGLKFSEHGQDAMTIESGQCLQGDFSCKMRVVRIRHNEVIDEEILFYAYYANSPQLSNVLMNTFDSPISDNVQNDASGFLWYFTNDLSGVTLIQRPSRLRNFRLIGDSLLLETMVNDQRVLVFAENILSSWNESENAFEDAIHLNVASSMYFEMTSDKNIYFISASDQHELHFSDQTYSRVFYDDNYSEVEFVISDCVSIDRYERSGEPDLIFFRRIREPETDSVMDRHVAARYYDLYVLEDRVGSVPELIAEKVGWVVCGDFGVYYSQLDQVASGLEAWTYSSVEDNEHFDEEELYDHLNLFYSVDGQVFEFVSKIEYRRLYGG